MTKNDLSNSDSDSGSTPIASACENKPANALASISRIVTDDELKESSGARKLLLVEHDRLITENNELATLRKSFYTKDKENAVLKERLSEFKSKWIIFDIAKIVGALLLGLLPSIWDMSTCLFVYLLILGVILIVGAFFAQRYFENREEQRKSE